ncbi:MAG: elongation factor G [Thermodesulfobacteriota bacterium]|nr:MAG: elongation factor G [Thermodesulfobacteriota bacterium]
MAEFSRGSIRNITLIAPHGAGKTSLAEAMLFMHGATDKLGKVDDGSSTLDYESEEKNRNMSINSHVAFFETKNHFINVVDTPGFLNFLYETDSATKIADGAVILVEAIQGEAPVQVRKYWDMAGDIPRLIFVNKLDRENTSLEDTVNSISNELGVKALLFTLPMGDEGNFNAVIDFVKMKAYTYDSDGNTQGIPIPEDMIEKAKAGREKIVEAVAELDDELLVKYLDGQEIDEDLMIKMLHQGILDAKIYPVFAGSATNLLGIKALVVGICRYLPSPIERNSISAKNGEGEEIQINPEEKGNPAGYIFKTISDPYAGKMSIFRVFSGSIKSDSTVYNSTKGVKEKLGHLHRLIGKKEYPVDVAECGDIVAVNKLKDARTGDTLCEESNPRIIPPAELPSAVLSFAIEPKSRNDEDKLNPSLAKIHEEDPTFQYHMDEETNEFLLSGTGQSHVEVLVNKLKEIYGVNVDLHTPRVPYKETIRGKSTTEAKYVKQTGGKGQYGVVSINIEPLPRGQNFEFVNKIVGGAIPKNYIPSVEKGIIDAMKSGELAGYPVVDVKVTLFDGKFHPVDSSDMAFQIAGSMAFKQGMKDAKPLLLEPVMKMEITIPEDSMGDVIGDVNSRRGKVSGVDSLAGSHLINALIPMSEVLTYAPELRSITSGRGTFTMDFSHYEEVPHQQAGKIIAESSKGTESEE